MSPFVVESAYYYYYFLFLFLQDIYTSLSSLSVSHFCHSVACALCRDRNLEAHCDALVSSSCFIGMSLQVLGEKNGAQRINEKTKRLTNENWSVPTAVHPSIAGSSFCALLSWTSTSVTNTLLDHPRSARVS